VSYQDGLYFSAPTFSFFVDVMWLFSDEEDSTYVLAPKPQRLGIASGLVAVGVGISAAMCLYPWR
jgi:hypothetical protein